MNNRIQIPASPRLGCIETNFFAYTQLRRKRTVTLGETAAALGLSATQEKYLLHRLNRAGLIVRVRNGLYLVPPQIPPGGRWSPGEAAAITSLFEDNGGRYQLCGPNAFYRYGFDDQVPNSVFIYNNRIYGERTIGSINLILIKVDEKRLGGTETVESSDGYSLVYSSRARTLVDAVYDWSRFNGIPRAYEWIRSELSTRPRIAGDIVSAALQFGNQGTVRRIGFVLERNGVARTLLRRLKGRVTNASSAVALVPSRSRTGTLCKTWGIIDNAP